MSEEETVTLDDLEADATREDAVAEAEEIVDDVMAYDRVGKYLSVPIVAIEEIEQDSDDPSVDEIRLRIDVPYGKDEWTYDKPYGWPSDNFFVKLCESHGYSEANFHEMIGEEVLVRPKGNGYWSLSKQTPTEVRTSPTRSVDSKHLARAAIVLIALLFLGLPLLAVFL